LGEVGDIIPVRGPTWIDADSFLDLRIDAALAGSLLRRLTAGRWPW
jgi:hypothetical protein